MMMKRASLAGLIALLCCAIAPAAQKAANAPIPHLARQGAATQLIVDGKPYLVLGGELHNSTSSSVDYMEPQLAKFASYHLNTVLGSVNWDMLEPEEGRYDFSQVDGLIQAARRHDLRVVLLWFASWKNAVSTYAPAWVKTDLQRFPRARDADGGNLDILSVFGRASQDADARAFAALMRHVRAVDAAHTVLMVQVQNEVGILGDARDHSAAAEAAFRQPVPKELIDSLVQNRDVLVPGLRTRWQAAGFKTSGSWQDVFGAGPETDEIFMAWHYARYVGAVAGAGKAEYPLPMFVNTWMASWQVAKPMKPGSYPSGGPMPNVMDIWRAGAPQIDILAPDIYEQFEERAALYHRAWNPLFIPELARDARHAANVMIAFGTHDAIGISPFGLESVPLFGDELAKSYGLIAQMAPTILAYQGRGVIGGAVLSADHGDEKVIVGDYTLTLGIARHYTFPTPDFPAGIFVQIGPDEFLIGARGLTVSFSPNTPGAANVGFLRVDDGGFVDGKWVQGRQLNGDEILGGKGLRVRGDRYMIQRVKLYRYR